MKEGRRERLIGYTEAKGAKTTLGVAAEDRDTTIATCIEKQYTRVKF